MEQVAQREPFDSAQGRRRRQRFLASPQHMRMSLSDLRISTSDRGITAVDLGARSQQKLSSNHRLYLDCCHKELSEYFRNTRSRFTFPCHTTGTSFQKKVWQELKSVPYGSVITYGELARRIHRPRAVRAVASAVARNPLAIVIPCHRVVPAAGGVGKYRWGIARKKWLLALESSSYARRSTTGYSE